MRYLIFIIIFTSVNAIGSTLNFNDKEQIFNYSSYHEASKSGSYVRFDMNSSLLGFITAHFSGYAKNFKLNWMSNGYVVKDLQIIIPVQFMDTDKDSRTEEMQVDCLEFSKFKNITVKINGPIELKKGKVPVVATATIRGKESTLKFKLTLEKLLGQWQVSSQLPVRLSDINILNPTIAKGLASFDENVRILFNFRIKN